MGASLCSCAFEQSKMQGPADLQRPMEANEIPGRSVLPERRRRTLRKSAPPSQLSVTRSGHTVTIRRRENSSPKNPLSTTCDLQSAIGFDETMQSAHSLHKRPPLRSCSSSGPTLAATSADVDEFLHAEFGEEDEQYPQVPFEVLQLPPHFQTALDAAHTRSAL